MSAAFVLGWVGEAAERLRLTSHDCLKLHIADRTVPEPGEGAHTDHVEAAELLEPFQWLTADESRALPEAQRDAVALEMADVLLYLVQLGNQLGVDVVAAAHRKIDINEGRFPPVRTLPPA